MVEPTEVDDDTAVLLSHEIAREIEDQLEYPGQVKVTVIRESRAWTWPATSGSIGATTRTLRSPSPSRSPSAPPSTL